MSRRGRPRTNKEPKRKAVKIRLCERVHSGKLVEPYRIMEEIIAADRPDLANLHIGIAWHTGWRPDADGVRTHGKCQKRSELDRSLDTYDAIIILNEKSWLAFAAEEKLRLICHELEHIQIASDKNGEPLIDDKGRQVIRMKRHNVADFASIIQKFGLPPCLSDVDIADAGRGLLQIAEEKAAGRTGETEGAGSPHPAPDIPEHTKLKFKGLRNCECEIDLVEKDGQWYAPYRIRVGNIERSRSGTDLQGHSRKVDALAGTKAAINTWLEEAEPTGGADAQRSMQRRIAAVCTQLDEQLDPLLPAALQAIEDNAAEQADGGNLVELEINADENDS